MGELSVRVPTQADRPAMERLWLMFQHDMSQFRHDLPFTDGSFRTERLEAAFTDPDRVAYLVTSDDRPVAFAIVRGLNEHRRVMNSFFVVRGLRRSGVGLHAVREVVARHPGAWEIAFQGENTGAVQFWRHTAEAIAPGRWTEELRAVPTRPELAPDSWISFSTDARSR
ncbi:GNAT family N-acetyltransferase [Actinomadura barringtoniae]|uniref:GNAT family N-acetyltransferase n=1 Tax=Actinomadura barringtoniae TaxID=1427535 RepID=A0A939PKL5_9ACTN|nr:GNAT family N-acetyltransferase [Actinomadura barringtoniae]MBO2454511.1 GNAT family N-acetyltransferase [Actinomadura barringtoniae]